ncbi:phage tail tip lysozyme [Kribbella kalugense]|uniref:Peptidase M23-like protein n=1 Tax=Kribbella kalugense TaxID=2512221 RepID=A0A4R7ZJF4_9ACTN|nr:phage tail tip lysozyme [Kribbella kalugense]TDW17889.1 peptidase M23-like protein [Kribbella kalugense]
MGASKVLPIVGGFLLLLFLPLLIVLVLLLGVLSGTSEAAAQCTTSAPDQAMFGWPTDQHKIDQDWAEADPDAGTEAHHAWDFKVPEESKVYASIDGKISYAKGDDIRIRNENVEVRYKFIHFFRGLGDTVKRGDQIGTSGSGDESLPGLSGAHVHFEMWVDKESNGDWSTQKPESNPFEADTSDSGGGGCSCATTDLDGANAQQQAFNYFVQNGWSKEQAAGIVGNMISESGVDPLKLNDGTPTGTKTQPADAISKPGAWGLVQWYPGKKMIQPSRDAGVDDKTIGSLAYQLDFVNKQINGKGPLPEPAVGPALRATKTPEDAAFTFASKFERFTLNPNDPEYDRRRANARHVFDTFAASAPAQGKPGDTSGCGAGSGNIAMVAKNLAWPQGPHAHWSVDASAAKPEYVEAMAKYNDGPNGQTPYSDCGRFVATVLHMSGADPKFPNVYTPTQRQYMLDHPEIYDHWESTPPGGMKPGDILNGPGHTYLYVGPWGDGNGWNSAAGSLGQHVPTADNLYGVGPSGFWVFRVKGGTTPTTTAN